jgi:radical SAM superfamily enzyme YgiQ (UPF0313 family)
MNMLPPAIALFSALLKREGHEVKLFDSTYYSTNYGIDSDGRKAEHLNVVPFNPDDRGIKMRTTDWRDDISNMAKSFNPDLIAISSTEDMWQLGIQLIEEIEGFITKNKIPVIAGGVFPTFAPQLAIKHRLVSMVGIGEGENTLLDLCDCIDRGKSYEHVTNLWIKQKDGAIRKNPITKPVDIDSNPIIDLSLFEEQRLLRPMVGKWYRMLPSETMRGCPYTCTYCNSPSQMSLYKTEANANFFRKRKMEAIHRELSYFKNTIKAEYIYFTADTFLAWSSEEFEEFCDMYSEIKLPFWFNTRPETISDYRMKRLAEVGLHRMNFGIEHGNEEFRARVLDRRWSNAETIETLKSPHRYGVQFSANNITGLPEETRELAMDTVELNRFIESDNQNLYAFMPFHGTPLRKKAESLGMVEADSICKSVTDKHNGTPGYSSEEIEGLLKCFALYVKFPKNRWKEIRKAEKETPEGKRIFSELRQEYIDRFFPKPDVHNTDKETPNVAELEYGVKVQKNIH